MWLYYKDPMTGRNKYYKTFRKHREAQEAINKLRDLIDNGKVLEVNKSKARITPLSFENLAKTLEAEWEEKLGHDELARLPI